MMKKTSNLLLAIITPLLSGCQIQNAEEYSLDFQQLLTGGSATSSVGVLTSTTAYLYHFSALSGMILFLLALILFLSNRRERFTVFLGFSGLAAAAVYLTPLLNLLKGLPGRNQLILIIHTILLVSCYLILRGWSISIFHHRKKPWTRYTRISVFTLAYLLPLLGWFRPGLTAAPWIVPCTAGFVFVDSTLCSVLSLRRKNDRSGWGGLFFSAAFISGGVWLLLTRGSEASLFRTLDNMAFLLPAILLPVQTLLTLVMIQAVSRKRQEKIEQMVQAAEEQEKVLQERVRELEDLQDNLDRALVIPSFNQKAAERALLVDPLNELKVPETWDGAHCISISSSSLPSLAAWSFQTSPGSGESDTLLMVEGSDEDRYAYLPMQMALMQMKLLIANRVSPVSLFKELNNSLSRLNEKPDFPLSAALIHLTGEEALCATAGNAIIWYRKPGGAIVPVSSEDVPATYQQGLGFRPYSRETGMPFRIKVEKGDSLIVTSRSLIAREQELNGEIYGKESLIRVLNNHDSADADQILSALIKDFDDFDMGNTRDRQVYAAVFRRK